LGHLAGRHIRCPRNGVLRPLLILFPGRGHIITLFSVEN
jgi:hypothetical protein